jgi:hypothetical protein
MDKKKYVKVKAPPSGKQVRHTHRTVAALEDAIAILLDILRTVEDVMEFVRQRAGNALEVIKQARKGPHAYDPDRKSGKRFLIKKR